MHEVSQRLSGADDSLTLISLNIWGGKVGEPLLDFFRKYGELVDIFCLQEVFDGAENVRPLFTDVVGDIYTRIREVLVTHQGYFCNEQDGEEGEAIFINKSLGVDRIHEVFVHRWRNAMEEDGRTLGRALQYAQFSRGEKNITVAQFHGLWNGQGKTDSTDRIAQSMRVKGIMDRTQGARILCGDFNLNPDTKSLSILEQGGFRNLVKEYGITSTRSSLYTKPERLADYMLVSPDIGVRDFRVLDETVSDHLPLYLEFS